LAETRERILDATVGIMRSRGWRGPPPRNRARCGSVGAALYRHFRSKEEIFLRVMRDGCLDHRGDQGPSLARGPRSRGGHTGGDRARPLSPTIPRLSPSSARCSRSRRSWSDTNRHCARRTPDRSSRSARSPPTSEPSNGFGRFSKALDAEAASALLLGACFQRAFLRQFLGTRAVDRDENAFEKLVSALLR